MRPEAGLVLKGVTFRNEAAAKIDLEERAVTLTGGTKLGYDYLVIATGASQTLGACPASRRRRSTSTRDPRML